MGKKLLLKFLLLLVMQAETTTGVSTTGAEATSSTVDPSSSSTVDPNGLPETLCVCPTKDDTEEKNVIEEIISMGNNLKKLDGYISSFDTNVEVKPEPLPEEQRICEIALPKSCKDVKEPGVFQFRDKTIDPNPFYMSCNAGGEGDDGWTVILRRQDGSTDFNLGWEEYKRGFGSLQGEFIMGLEMLNKMTMHTIQELLVVIQRSSGERNYAYYSSFAIGCEEQGYALNVLGNYTGDANDYLRYHEGMKFSTSDKDNDENGSKNCAETNKGAWWFKNCDPQSLLTGPYNSVLWGKDEKKDIYYAVMMIRPQRKVVPSVEEIPKLSTY